MFFEILSWVMSGIALTGTILNTERNKWGQAFWVISNIYMCVADWKAGLYAQSVLFFVYFLLAIRGIYVWHKKEKQDDTKINVKIKHL